MAIAAGWEQTREKGSYVSRRIIKKAMAELRPALIIDLRPTALGNYGALAARLYGARHRVSLDRIRLKENYGQGRKMKWKRHEAETFCAALEEAGILKRQGDYRSSLTFWKRPVGDAPVRQKVLSHSAWRCLGVQEVA